MTILEQEALRLAWSQIRTGGRRNFVIQWGLRRFALRLGLVVWLTLFVVVPVLLVPRTPPDLAYFGSREFWVASLAGAVLWPLAGWAWAVLEWRRREREYLGNPV